MSETTERIKCLIIGSGPAGYTAAIYAARADMNPIMYTGMEPGGQLTTTTEVDNFPGYPEGIDGPTMMVQLQQQAERFGTQVRIGIYELFPSDFTKGNDSIPINGLVWMGEKSFMKSQIETKIKEGFKCIKLKIGAIDFQSEIELLKYIRSQFSEKDIEIRVDANGAFSTKDALEKLKTLSEFKLHSIEQPIQQGQWQEMAKLCEKTPLDIALDEELIGVFKSENKSKLLNTIKPQYIILKPSLIGGFKGSKSWISLARSLKVGWWLTSALESNVGLNAISQFTYNLDTSMYQGLGTGSLYTNNFESPLYIKKGHICYDPNLNWNVSFKD